MKKQQYHILATDRRTGRKVSIFSPVGNVTLEIMYSVWNEKNWKDVKITPLKKGR